MPASTISVATIKKAFDAWFRAMHSTSEHARDMEWDKFHEFLLVQMRADAVSRRREPASEP